MRRVFQASAFKVAEPTQYIAHEKDLNRETAGWIRSPECLNSHRSPTTCSAGNKAGETPPRAAARAASARPLANLQPWFYGVNVTLI